MGEVLLVLMMLATAVVLILGIATMIKGGEFNQKHGNKMMVLRVAFQGGTLLLLGILFLLSQSK